MSQPYNPYAAPRDAPSDGSGGSPYQRPEGWEGDEVTTLAWERFKLFWPLMTLACFIYFLLIQLVNQGPTLAWRMAFHLTMTAPVPQFIVLPSAIVGLVIGSFLQVGFLRMCLEAARGQAPKLGTLFLGGDKLMPMLALTLLVYLAVFVGVLLLIVPGVIVALGVFPAYFYMVDPLVGRRMGAFECLRASWSATKGQKGSIFVLSLRVWGIMILGLLACCIGSVPATAVAYMVGAVLYTRLSGVGVAVPDVDPTRYRG